MSFGACGFNMAPALLLIFTRVLMLQTHRTQLLSLFNKSKKPYDSNHEEVLHFMPIWIYSVTEPDLSTILFFTFYYRNIHAYIILERITNEILCILYAIQQLATFGQFCFIYTSTIHTHILFPLPLYYFEAYLTKLQYVSLRGKHSLS